MESQYFSRDVGRATVDYFTRLGGDVMAVPAQVQLRCVGRQVLQVWAGSHKMRERVSTTQFVRPRVEVAVVRAVKLIQDVPGAR